MNVPSFEEGTYSGLKFNDEKESEIQKGRKSSAEIAS